MWLHRRKGRHPRSLGEALAALPHGWCVAGSELGHIAVGPGGIFLLNGFANGEAAVGAAKLLRRAIDEETGLRLWVQPVVVRWGEYTDQVLRDDNVVYLHGGRVASWLADRPGALSRGQRHALELALSEQAA
jgi:hypothetical protein